MDANGSRFHLLLGRDDWGRCREAHAGAEPLGLAWDERRDGAEASPARLAGFDWDEAAGEILLRNLRERFPAPPGDRPVTPADRRGAAADRYGNLYWIDASRTAILARSPGSGQVSRHWPDDSAPPAPGRGEFREAAPPPAPQPDRLAALTVTDDHYLVVATSPPAGLHVFDLLAGGPPVTRRWPDPAFAPIDAAPRPGCGAWILEAGGRAWALDGRFGVVGPLDTGAVAALAIETLPDGRVLVLDGGDAHRAPRVLGFRDGERITPDFGWTLDFAPHDFVGLPGESGGRARLLVAAAEGNQAFAFDLADGEPPRLVPVTDFYPMRRFGGRALVRIGTAPAARAFYDFGEGWVPLMRQPRVRHVEEAALVTEPLDGADPQCTWHRLVIEGCIPPQARVAVYTRASDEREALSSADPGAGGGWNREPTPYRRARGSELPWRRDEPARGAGAEHEGAFELLFQKARGRYLQVKLVFTGDGRSTPRLRALRAWYPRFSYVERYLPAIYREDRESASFLERFLANLEGTFTAIEDRIAAVHALLDVRSAPREALAWLADWFGVALDPAWDERRQRLFIRHAMDFFQYRGTVHGLRMALHLALDREIREEDLGPPTGRRAGAANVRLVEKFLHRRPPVVELGRVHGPAQPTAISADAPWSPREGNAGLVRRYHALLGRAAPTPAEEAEPFALEPPTGGGDAERDRWASFMQATIGTVPSGGAAERRLWQAFLATRHPDVAALNAAHRSAHAGFAQVPLPEDEPPVPAQAEDWKAFVRASRDDPALVDRARWQDFLALRYRRVEALNARHGTRWSSFAWIPQPDHLPRAADALEDWLAFELRVRPMHAHAHAFRVLLPAPPTGLAPEVARERMQLARRIVELEKPAHTVFEVGFFWALFRIGEARLGEETLLGRGSRAPELFPDAELGRDFVGGAFVAGPQGLNEPGRLRLAC